jgi:hypothetical protein
MKLRAMRERAVESAFEAAAQKIPPLVAGIAALFLLRYLLGSGLSLVNAWAVLGGLCLVAVLAGIPIAILLTDRGNSRNAKGSGKPRHQVNAISYNDGTRTARFWIRCYFQRAAVGLVVSIPFTFVIAVILRSNGIAAACTSAMRISVGLAPYGALLGAVSGAVVTFNAADSSFAKDGRWVAIVSSGAFVFVIIVVLLSGLRNHTGSEAYLQQSSFWRHVLALSSGRRCT